MAREADGLRVAPVAWVCAGVALVARLLLLFSRLGAPDGDGAVSGLMALDMLAGEHVWLLFPGQKYAGTLDVWLQAASMAVFGVSQVSLGLPMALLEAGTVGMLAGLVGWGTHSRGTAVVAGLVAAVYPWWWLWWGTVWPGGYALSVALGTAALGLALLLRPLPRWAAVVIGLLLGTAVWSQPLTISYAAATVVMVVVAAPGVAWCARRAVLVLLGAAPAGLLWWWGLRDGTNRDLSKVQEELTPGQMLVPAELATRADDLLGAITRQALGLATSDVDLLVPLPVAHVLCVVFWLAVLRTVVTAGGRIVRWRAHAGSHTVPEPRLLLEGAIAFVVLFAAAVYILFPPASFRFMPRYFFPALPMVGILVVLWGSRFHAVVRDGRRAPAVGLPAASRGTLITIALVAFVVSTAMSAANSLEGGLRGTGGDVEARNRQGSRVSLADLERLSGRLEAQGIECLVGGYWSVYPVGLASAGRLEAQSTFVNRFEKECGPGESTAVLFSRAPDGRTSAEEEQYVAQHPGDPLLEEQGFVAYRRN